MVVGKEPCWITLEYFQDSRGLMGILEDHKIPFEVRRTFWISRIPDNAVRGGHAHRTSEQVLICVHGTIEVELESLSGRKYEFQLSPYQYRGLYLPPLYWGGYIFREQAMALCMASDHFDEMDYIRDYQEFEQLKYADRS
jgi:dTDP-4-dehydrorhamnose 3,5-epimerase-like enzyme